MSQGGTPPAHRERLVEDISELRDPILMIFFSKKSRHLVLDDLHFFRVFVTAWSFDSARFRQKLFDFRRCLELFLVAMFIVYDYSEPQKMKFNDGDWHSDTRTPYGEALYPPSGHQLPSKSPKFT